MDGSLLWSFREIPPREVKQNPQHLEYFRSDALREVTDALVREDIQNRLDAHDENSPAVEVRYSFVDDSVDYTGSWFDGLQEHLEADEVRNLLGNESINNVEAKVPCLVIEDFNTTGLKGSPTTYRDPKVGDSERNDFYWFIRNVGRSGKADGDRGRWGLGKIVYPASSKIRSFFSYSVTADDQPPTLIGRSVLCIHSPDKEKDYASDGFFSFLDDETQMDLPSSDSSIIDKFKKDFRIKRGNEPGLSLVLPFPDNHIQPSDLIISLIDHWFWVFLDQSLVVRVYLPDDSEVVIGSGTLEDVVLTYFSDEAHREAILRKIAFVREILASRSGKAESVGLDIGDQMLSWAKFEDERLNDELVQNLRDQYSNGELLSFKLNLPVKLFSGEKKEGYFHLYIKRSDSSHPATDATLREGLTISALQSVRVPGVSVLLYVGNNPLGTVLGDSENPAHTTWHFRGMNSKYPEGAKIVKFVSDSAQRILSILSRVDEGLDRTLLENFFSIPDPDQKLKPAPTKKGKSKPFPEVPEIRSKNYYLSCDRVKGGFRVRAHEKLNQSLHGFTVRVAYEVARGNPFKKHNAADFDLSQLKKSGLSLSVVGVCVSSANPSKMSVDVTDNVFDFILTGFDENRDLIIDVKPIRKDQKILETEE